MIMIRTDPDYRIKERNCAKEKENKQDIERKKARSQTKKERNKQKRIT